MITFILFLFGIIILSSSIIYLIQKGVDSKSTMSVNSDDQRLFSTYSLLGLAISLSISYAAMECITQIDSSQPMVNLVATEEAYTPISFEVSLKPKLEPKLEPKQNQQTKPKLENITQVDDDKPLKPNTTPSNENIEAKPVPVPTTRSGIAVGPPSLPEPKPISIPPPKPTEPTDFPDVMAEYPGGINALRKEVQKTFSIPRSYSQLNKSGGTIVVRFVIDEDGNVERVTILKGMEHCEPCNEEAVKVIKNLKQKFVPGKMEGKPVKVWFIIPIIIKMK